jgi:hypothetical protein
MMARQLTCDCGAKLLVSDGAAGHLVQCNCGRTVVVPSLHELRQLPFVPGPDDPQPATPKKLPPISAVCPKCGEKQYTAERPSRWVAFADDRICTSCGTRYSPPTPRWAAVVFILVGLSLVGLGPLALFSLILSFDPRRIPTIAVEVVFSLVGVLAIAQGIRALARPGKV